ncbi:hypothetical protein [Acinetobacter sp. BY419]|uniref:hypothetical protein n=1 Tax=Acinetobacter sp. BY419 TaxID=2820675 RepID=UPI001C224DFB|nr:hypothetical protein [Acinetobacter sp. BY419]
MIPSRALAILKLHYQDQMTALDLKSLLAAQYKNIYWTELKIFIALTHWNPLDYP